MNGNLMDINQTFEYRLFKYWYSFDKNKFSPAQFAFQNYNFSQIYQKYSKGLDDATYEENIVKYGNQSFNTKRSNIFWIRKKFNRHPSETMV